jgi:hypothetical protein
MEHVVCAKHAWPTGHSVEERLVQGVAQLLDASSKLVPQKKESSGASISFSSIQNDGIPSSLQVVYL